MRVVYVSTNVLGGAQRIDHSLSDYAKLMRKRDKQIAAEGQAPRIDMETLRASARAADLDKSHARAQTHTSSSQAPPVQPQSESTSPVGPSDQPHHQGSFQVVTIGPSGSSAGLSAHTMLPHPPQGAVPSHDNSVTLASWTAPGLAKGHGYAPVSSQSFVRTSQHGGSNDVSPR